MINLQPTYIAVDGTIVKYFQAYSNAWVILDKIIQNGEVSYSDDGIAEVMSSPNFYTHIHLINKASKELLEDELIIRENGKYKFNPKFYRPEDYIKVELKLTEKDLQDLKPFIESYIIKVENESVEKK